MNKITQLKKGERVATIAIFLESFLAASKAVVGWLSGSVVLISDSLHSASDLMPIIASWLGLKIAQKEPDERFAYGYYKAENIAAAIISVLVLFAAWNVFKNGLELLTSSSSLKMPLLALFVSLADALILFFFGSWEISVAEEINSSSLLAMGKENRTHIFTSGAVFVGILAALFQLPYLEGLITMAISLLILQIGLSSGKDALLALMDVSPSKKIEKKIAQTIRSVPGLEELKNLKLRKTGPFIMGEARVGIRKSVDVHRAHQIADRVEEKIKEKVSSLDSITVHIEPFKSDYRHLVIPVEQKKGLQSTISPKFGRSAYLLFINLKGKEVKGQYCLKNPHQDHQVRAGLGTAKLAADKKIDTLLTKEIGEIAFHTLQDYLVDIYQTKQKTAQKAIDQLNQGKLSQLKEATKERKSQ